MKAGAGRSPLLDAAHPADGVTAWEYDCVIYNGVSDEARTLDSMILDWSALREHINLELGPRG